MSSHRSEETSRSQSSGRATARALIDVELIDAMRHGDVWAWHEFDCRFRPGLEAYAARVGIPSSTWDECINDVLEDTAVRVTRRAGALPANFRAYLITAMRNRAKSLARSTARRERWYRDASHETGTGEVVVPSLHSQSALRVSESAVQYGGEESPRDAATNRGVARLATLLFDELSDSDRQLVAWVAEAVPHREIAAWLGATYEATTKRIWRLCRRLRQRAPAHLDSMTPEERRDVRHIVECENGLTSDNRRSGARRLIAPINAMSNGEDKR
jgi:DNA-directed RNA polymerase specialized sigma24 family protein